MSDNELNGGSDTDRRKELKNEWKRIFNKISTEYKNTYGVDISNEEKSCLIEIKKYILSLGQNST